MQPHIVLAPLSEAYGTTVGTTVSALPSIPTDGVRAIIQVETAAIRAKFNNTNSVTTGVTLGVGGGYLMVPGVDYVIEGYDNLNRMRVVNDATSTPATINVIYFGEGVPS